MKTYLPKVNQNEKQWHLIDADGVVVGRLAVQIANILRGKDLPVFTKHLDAGGFVVVVNAEKVLFTGKKETDKQYMTYSGWRSGDKYHDVSDVRKKHPERIIMNAVKGMLPKNRLSRQLITKLKVYAGTDHPHKAQQPEVIAA